MKRRRAPGQDYQPLLGPGGSEGLLGGRETHTQSPQPTPICPISCQERRWRTQVKTADFLGRSWPGSLSAHFPVWPYQVGLLSFTLPPSPPQVQIISLWLPFLLSFYPSCFPFHPQLYFLYHHLHSHLHTMKAMHSQGGGGAGRGGNVVPCSQVSKELGEAPVVLPPL